MNKNGNALTIIHLNIYKAFIYRNVFSSVMYRWKRQRSCLLLMSSCLWLWRKV